MATEESRSHRQTNAETSLTSVLDRVVPDPYDAITLISQYFDAAQSDAIRNR